MMRLKNWLLTILPNKEIRHRQIIISVMLLVAVIGFADATHLTISHYTGSELRCGVSGGCNIVATSVYSKIFGVPVALLGSLYYATIILLSVAYFDTKKQYFFTLLTILPAAGLVASAYFVYIQLFILQTICIYCMVSAGTSTLIFLLSLMLKKK